MQTQVVRLDMVAKFSKATGGSRDLVVRLHELGAIGAVHCQIPVQSMQGKPKPYKP